IEFRNQSRPGLARSEVPVPRQRLHSLAYGGQGCPEAAEAVRLSREFYCRGVIARVHGRSPLGDGRQQATGDDIRGSKSTYQGRWAGPTERQEQLPDRERPEGVANEHSYVCAGEVHRPLPGHRCYLLWEPPSARI